MWMSPERELAGRAGALLVHRHLPVGLHVVEDGHLLASDDGHLPHLVGVEPGEVHVRDLPAREAQEAEDDVLDAFVDRPAALCGHEVGILVEQVQDHAQVVHAERPERVLVAAHDPEVHAVAVDAAHVAELAGVDQLLELEHGGVVEQQVAGHQNEAACIGQRHELVHLSRSHGRRLLDEDVLACLERSLRERVVGRHRCRDHHCVELVVVQQVVEVRRRARVRVALGTRGEVLLVEVAKPPELGEVGEVAGEVRAPVVEADDSDRRH